MNRRATPTADYRAHLTQLARALATARSEKVCDALEAGSSPEELRLFVEDNAGKRLDMLRTQLEFVARAFDDIEERLRDFLRAVPLAAYATTLTDADRFLDWLEQESRLTPEQRDHVACQRARHAVEAEARRNRLAYVRFQELSSMAARLAEELDSNPSLLIHQNPARARARFVTPALLDEDAKTPADVLFFAYAGEISAAVLDRGGRRLVRALARRSPSTLEDLRRGGDRDEWIACCRDLAALGLIAFS